MLKIFLSEKGGKMLLSKEEFMKSKEYVQLVDLPIIIPTEVRYPLIQLGEIFNRGNSVERREEYMYIAYWKLLVDGLKRLEEKEQPFLMITPTRLEDEELIKIPEEDMERFLNMSIRFRVQLQDLAVNLVLDELKHWEEFLLCSKKEAAFIQENLTDEGLDPMDQVEIPCP